MPLVLRAMPGRAPIRRAAPWAVPARCDQSPRWWARSCRSGPNRFYCAPRQICAHVDGRADDGLRV